MASKKCASLGLSVHLCKLVWSMCFYGSTRCSYWDMMVELHNVMRVVWISFLTRSRYGVRSLIAVAKGCDLHDNIWIVIVLLSEVWGKFKIFKPIISVLAVIWFQISLFVPTVIFMVSSIVIHTEWGFVVSIWM